MTNNENTEKICCLEYSHYSDKQKLFPFHIGTLEKAIRDNLVDFWHNNRGNNKWQIVFIGTRNECQEVMDGLIAQKPIAYYNSQPKD